MLDGHQIRNGTLLQVAYNYYGYKQTPAGRYAIIRNSTADIDCIFLQLGGGIVAGWGRWGRRRTAPVLPSGSSAGQASAARWNAAGVVDFISN